MKQLAQIEQSITEQSQTDDQKLLEEIKALEEEENALDQELE